MQAIAAQSGLERRLGVDLLVHGPQGAVKSSARERAKAVGRARPLDVCLRDILISDQHVQERLCGRGEPPVVVVGHRAACRRLQKSKLVRLTALEDMRCSRRGPSAIQRLAATCSRMCCSATCCSAALLPMPGTATRQSWPSPECRGSSEATVRQAHADRRSRRSTANIRNVDHSPLNQSASISRASQRNPSRSKNRWTASLRSSA